MPFSFSSSISNGVGSSGGQDARYPANTGPSSATASSYGIERPSTTELNDSVIERLSELATAALNSPDKETRDGAAQQLLFLSSYEYWDTLRALLPRAQNNYLRFIVVKGLLFLVSNELGPQERTEMQQYVLEYLQERRRSGEQLPFYLYNALFSVYASALFSNWKISIIRAESAEMVDSSEMAHNILAKLQTYLTTEETLDCVLEILTFFARQNSRLSILSVKSSFAKQVLPFFFSAAASMLSSAPEKAALVCSTALECAPELDAPMVRLHHPSDTTITVLRWPAWAPALSQVMNECGQALLNHPEGPCAALYSRLLRQCSTVTSPQEEYIASRDDVANVLLDVSGRLVLKVQENPGRTELLRLACALLVNTFERNDETTVAYLARDPGVIRVWADATRYVLSRPFDDEEADLRQALLHLFFMIAERMLPPKPRGGRSLEESFTGHYGACTPPRTREGGLAEPGFSAERLGRQPHPLPVGAPRGPLSSEHTREVEQQVIDIFSTYVDLVINTAHEREESQELRMSSTFVLQAERMLQPIAEVLFCERIDLLPQLVDRLQQTIRQYELCIRARGEQQAAMHSAAATGGDGGIDCFGLSARSLLQELYMTLAVQNMSVGAALSSPAETTESTPLFFTYVCLSRLSVIVSIFAIALLQGTANQDDSVLGAIAAFACQLLVQEDQVTANLLQCLSLLDDGNDDLNDFGGTTALAMPTSSGHAAQVHIGILRSLFFFCSCVYETNLSRREEFYDITVNLLCYVYRYHSDQVALVGDANILLTRIVDFGSSGTFFLGAGKLMGLIEAVKEDELPLLRAPLTPPFAAGALQLPSEVAEARHGFLTAFTFYVETRYYAGFPIADVISALTERCFDDTRMRVSPRLSFQDLKAITKGIHQPDTLQLMLESIIRHKDVCSAVVRYETAVAPDMVAWLSVLCSRSGQYMDEENLSTTQWELTSLVMNVLCFYFSHLSYPSSPMTTNSDGTPAFGAPSGVDGGVALSDNVDSSFMMNGGSGSTFFSFPADAVEAAVVYDVSDILNTFCSAPWCNLGIVLYYERATVEHFFCGAVELLTTTSVQLLMSEEGRARVFNAMSAAVNSSGHTFQQLHLLYMRQGVWNRLVRQLTKCLSYMYAPELIDILYAILRSDHEARQRVPHYKGLEEYTLAATFNEICTLVAVAPHLTYREMAACFGLLQMCYDSAKMLCGEYADRLLDLCSAYHRVRLRLIINSLRRGDGTHLMTEYMTYFGQSSNVGVLTAW
ncbi:conserved hypothetical protein [Leishmania braziliensis MHOM/BR/75/M2904]|uniref:Uncharacterized protein n=2 Tax=Leishmania braziliensis TaxID=5660 RepID=A4H9E2_LEIBR|nr:conserved hypothetical protein [Leishmania braziliensis MHOM/BR/75/M2904]CAJ2470314.1 unnamed protein product [Leishmania braziliensis]CAJ2470831.1 unnamed protein product [Leishmania braziliensis]CAM38014.1 conserved hypothetical protein [Leishmania braziliensis MHOM/BR/75/M2904]